MNFLKYINKSILVLIIFIFSIISFVKAEETETLEEIDSTTNSVTTVQEVLGDMMGDAPACNECGHITIRNGSCYKCLNCGNSLGCS